MWVIFCGVWIDWMIKLYFWIVDMGYYIVILKYHEDGDAGLICMEMRDIVCIQFDI
jgi:hypothetical protein